MSLPLNDECPTCFGYVGMTARMMGEKHRCTCPDPDEEQMPKPVPYDRMVINLRDDGGSIAA